MDFKAQYQFFKRIQEIVSETTGAECRRADEILNPGGDLRPKIHAAIDAASFVIADVSTRSVNVYYELGYAIAVGKLVIILARHDAKLPIDLAGVEVLRYTDTREGESAWQDKLTECLRERITNSKSLLHSFVLPEKPEPSYIVANPKLPDDSSRFKYHPAEMKTYGDYLGVSGVFGAFASFYGESFVPELVSAAHASDELFNLDANLYMIGSPKVNRFTERFLPELQDRCDAEWRLYTSDKDKGPDPPCRLTCRLSPRKVLNRVASEGGVDYGIVIRGAHPRFSSRLVMILAGPHSLGTGAACLAATRTELIAKIRDLINDDQKFMDHSRTLRILVKGTAGRDRHIATPGVEIVHAECCSSAEGSRSSSRNRQNRP